MKISNVFRNIGLAGYGVLILTYTVLYYTQFSKTINLVNIGNIGKILALLMLFLGFFSQKYSFKELLLLLGAIVFSAFVSYQNKTNDLVITVITIILLKNIEFKKIVEIDFFVRLISTLCIVFLSLLNYIPSLDIYRAAGVVRHSFGFYHPNLFGAYIMILTFEFIYLGYTKNKSKVRIWAILPIVLFVEKTTNDRSVVVSLLAFFVLYMLLRYTSLKRLSSKTFKFLLAVILFFVSTISILSTYLYNPTINLWIIINKLLSGRPELINSIVKQFYPVHLMGQPTPLVGDTNGIMMNGTIKYLFADNTYMAILVKFGIVTFALFILWVINNSFLMLSGENRIIMFCWLVAMLLWGLSESKIVIIQFNILLLSYVELNKKKE